jgi:hypothetical protein
VRERSPQPMTRLKCAISASTRARQGAVKLLALD